MKRLEPLTEVWILNQFCRPGAEKSSTSGETMVERKTSGCRKQPGLNFTRSLSTPISMPPSLPAI